MKTKVTLKNEKIFLAKKYSADLEASQYMGGESQWVVMDTHNIAVKVL